MSTERATSSRLRRLVEEICLPDGFRVVVGDDPVEDGGKSFLQVAARRRDVVTGEMGEGKGGKAYPSKHACDSEIVGATFGLYKSYLEHEARETFRFRGRRIYGPHIDVRALHDAAASTDATPRPPCADVPDLLADVRLADGHRLVVETRPGATLLRVVGPHHDITTRATTEVLGEPAYLPEDATDTGVLDAALGAYRRFVEDEARATFTFRGRRIYDSHVDAAALWAACTRIDVRAS